VRAPEPADRREAILDAALALAGERGWGGFHLHDVAERLGIPLVEIARFFPDKDALGNRLFARATEAMLALRDDAAFRTLSTEERAYRAIAAWFGALAEHRAVARDIFLYKLAPSHVHLQAALVVALSRTVQWVREAAGLETAGRARRREETRLTLVFAATFAFWLTDRSPEQERTLAFLRRRLERAGASLAWA
jgi:AcrR family transcriptional regulator